MNNKKVLMTFILGVFVLMFAMQFVAAAGLDGPVNTDSQWLNSFLNFFGDTWKEVIVSLVIVVIVYAASYDILLFTAFETEWVKHSIAAGIAVIASMAGGINALTRVVYGIIGGSVVVATAVVIIVAIFFFVGSSFIKSKKMHQKAKRTAQGAQLGFANAAAGIAGAAKLARATEKASREKL